MANAYDLGDVVQLTGTFTDPLDDDAAIDPTKVYCTIREPDGTATTYEYGLDAEINKSSTGIYTMNVDADSAGVWYYRWWSTGNGKAAEEDAFRVAPAKAIVEAAS
jgi:hypothetical protein